MQELLQNLGIDWKILIAQTINFVLILWLLNRFVFKKIVKHLDERKNKIEQGLVLTEKAKREIEQISEARQREIKKAREEAEKILNDARSSSVEKEKAAMSLARLEAEKVIGKAKMEAVQEKKDAVLEAKSEIKKLALMVAEKMLHRSVKEEDQENAAREILENLEKTDYAKQV